MWTFWQCVACDVMAIVFLCGMFFLGGESGKVYTYYKSTMEPMYVSTEDDIASRRMNGTLDESNLSIAIKARKK